MALSSRPCTRTGLCCALFFFLFSVALFPQNLSAQTNSEQVSAITSALRSRDFSKALELLEPALQQSPGNSHLLTLQALAFTGEGKKKEALASFRAALKSSPDYLPALEGAAQIEYESGGDDAVPLLEHVLRLQPNDQTSHAMLAVLAYKRGDCAGVLTHFEHSGALATSQPSAMQAQGECLVKLKQYDRAISMFQQMLALNSSDEHARYQLAVVQLMAQHPKDALDTLAPALQSANASAKTMQLAASAYEATGDTPNAVRTLRQAIVTDPKDTDLYLDFANLCMDHQSFQVGVDMIASGLRLQPDSAQLYVARGVLYVQLAKYDEAEADFEKANSIDPAASLGSVAQGLEAVQSNDPDRALATVKAKLASKPNDAYLWYLQADVIAQKGVDPGTAAFDKALQSARKAVTLQPSLTAARDVLAKLYLQSGQTQLAIEQCRKALATDPKDQTALYHLIQGLRKTGSKEEIPELLKRLADLRADTAKQESERNRYKLVEDKSPSQPASRP
jgi:tetratricopeptide (TPR) repeat protein